MTVEAVNHLVQRMQRAQQETFFDMLSHDDRNSSYIIAWTDGGRWRQRAFKAASLDLSAIPSRASVYMTRNGFVGGKRESGRCRQVNAMMFDIDCHTATFLEDVPKVVAVVNDAVERRRIPVPNMLVDTGRGVQIYFVLEKSISFRASDGNLNDKGLTYFKDVEGALSNTLKDLFEPMSGVQLDASVLDYARVGRIPGTYNPKAGRWCTLLSSSDSYYSLKDLKAYGTRNAFSHIKRAQTIRTKRRSGLLRARLSGIERLQRHRGFSCLGSRENMCFVYYNTATQIYGPDKALALTHELNSKFVSPLPPSDIDQIAKTVDGNTVLYGAYQGEKGFYPLRASTVVEKLFMTNAEMEAIQFFGTKRQRDRAALKAKNRAARKSRDERIIRKYKMGQTQQQVADSVGCSKRTVAYVLTENGITRSDRLTLEEKFNLVIEDNRESAVFGHTSWLCERLGEDVVASRYGRQLADDFRCSLGSMPARC